MAQPQASLINLRRQAQRTIAERESQNNGQGRKPLGRLETALHLQQVEIELQNAELRRALVELESRAERDRECFNLCPLPYLTLDARGHITEANVEATELLQMPRLVLLGRSLQSFLSEADADHFHRFRRAVLLSSQPQRLDLRVHSGKGGDVAIRVHARSNPARSDCPGGCRLVLVPATEQSSPAGLQAPSSPRPSKSERKRSDSVLYAATDTGKVFWQSPASAQSWQQAVCDGLSSGGKWLQFILPDDQVRVAEARRKLLTGRPFDEAYRIVLPDRSIRWVSEQAYPIRGAPLAIVGVIRDAMGEPEMEQELSHYRKQESLESFAAGVAHDLGNVFQGITGCLELAMQQSNVGDAKLGLVRDARSAAWRGAQLVGKLLGFARKAPNRLSCIDLCHVIRDFKPLLARLVCEDIRIETRFAVEPAPIVADALQIEQILLNLASNARDAMPLGGTLLIEVDEVAKDRDRTPAIETAIRLRVTDTGSGMDEQTRQRAAEPFFTTKGIGEGTGLGLSTVSSVTRSLGGRVQLDSVIGEGTRIVVELPKGQFVVPTQSSESEGGALSGRVLIVDDDPLIRSTLTAQLKRLGLEVLEAESAGMALTLDLEGVDVLVSDVTMPGMSGPGLANLLTVRWPALEVLYMSATPLAELARRGQLAADANLLEKPFEPHQLVARLRAHLPSSPVASVCTSSADRSGANSWGSQQ